MVDRKAHEVLPLEPLRALEVAVELIPMRTMAALYIFLNVHKAEFPARYIRTRVGGMIVEKRMLYDSEIRRIREMLLIPEGQDRYHGAAFNNTRAKRGRPSGRSLIDSIIARATSQVS